MAVISADWGSSPILNDERLKNVVFQLALTQNSYFWIPMFLAEFELPVQSPKRSAKGIEYSIPFLIFQVWANSDCITFLQI